MATTLPTFLTPQSVIFLRISAEQIFLKEFQRYIELPPLAISKVAVLVWSRQRPNTTDTELQMYKFFFQNMANKCNTCMMRYYQLSISTGFTPQYTLAIHKDISQLGQSKRSNGSPHSQNEDHKLQFSQTTQLLDMYLVRLRIESSLHLQHLYLPTITPPFFPTVCPHNSYPTGAGCSNYILPNQNNYVGDIAWEWRPTISLLQQRILMESDTSPTQGNPITHTTDTNQTKLYTRECTALYILQLSLLLF